MDNKSYDQLLIMQDRIDSNIKYYDDKMKNLTDDLTEIIVSMMDKIKIYKSSSYKKDSPKAQDNTTVFSDNKTAPPLNGGHYTKIGSMWTLKHEISSSKFYELLWLKGYTAIDLKNLYNHIKMCLNLVTRL